MSQIYRQGLNWLIVDFISNLSFADKVLKNVTDHDWSDFTSAKGEKSRQHYIINPSWLPKDDFVEPEGWSELKSAYENMVQKELVNYGIMPIDWKKIHACSAWTVVGEEGSYHTAHEHGPNNISTVTYIDVPQSTDENQGQVFFVLHSDPYSNLSPPNFRVFHIKPQKGMILIFPSWLVHGVYPQAAGRRQTLNIDFNGNPNYNFRGLQASSANYG
jgi:uncharacterized protein (TIGR02466 family)